MRKLAKKVAVLALAGLLVFSLSGCKKKAKKDQVQRYAWQIGRAHV